MPPAAASKGLILWLAGAREGEPGCARAKVSAARRSTTELERGTDACMCKRDTEQVQQTECVPYVLVGQACDSQKQCAAVLLSSPIEGCTDLNSKATTATVTACQATPATLWWGCKLLQTAQTYGWQHIVVKVVEAPLTCPAAPGNAPPSENTCGMTANLLFSTMSRTMTTPSSMRSRNASYAPADHQLTTLKRGWPGFSQPPMSWTCDTAQHTIHCLAAQRCAACLWLTVSVSNMFINTCLWHTTAAGFHSFTLERLVT